MVLPARFAPAVAAPVTWAHEGARQADDDVFFDNVPSSAASLDCRHLEPELPSFLPILYFAKDPILQGRLI